jgi:Zn-dependent protease with chaperone function
MVDSAALEVPMEMTILQWILTYAIHSSVLILFVWLVTKVLRFLSLSTQEFLWKAALLGGMATATLQMAIGLASPWGQLALPAALDTAPVAVAQRAEPAPASAAPVDLERRVVVHRTGDMEITTIRERRPEAVAAAPVVTRTTEPMTPSAWPWVILGLVGLGSAISLVRLAAGARSLRRRLAGRREVVEDPLLENFLVLADKAGFGDPSAKLGTLLDPPKAKTKARRKRLKLTASDKITSPLALWRREVVVPERAITGLTPPQQRAMLAHEIAHVVRRDPLWAVVTATVGALFFFQPLNFLARRKIGELAEYQCDEWAAQHTGSGAHLAKAIAAVAGWVERGERSAPLATTMARPGTSVLRRVRRLMRFKTRPAEGNSRAAMRLGGTLAMLGGVVWLAPGIARSAHRQAADDPANETADAKPILAAMVADEDEGDDVVFREVRTEDGHDKAQVRIETQDEVVKVEVERDPAIPPVPEPPEPPASEGSVRISIGGFFDTFGWGHGWGYVDIDVGTRDDLEDAIERHLDMQLEGLESDLEHELNGMFRPGFPFAHSGGHRWGHHQRERALERAERARRVRAAEARARAEQTRAHAGADRGGTVYSL